MGEKMSNKKKNVLFIGPYRQDDGWGHYSQRVLHALTLTSHNITAKPIFLANRLVKSVPDYVLKAEGNVQEKYDLVVQNCPPSYFSKIGGVKNVGLSHFETTISESCWPSYIVLMDEMWVATEFEEKMLNDDITNNTFVLPAPLDLSIYDKAYADLALLENKRKNLFRLYCIAEYCERKNIHALIMAYYRAFKIFDNVLLVLKLSGVDEQGAINDIQQIQRTMNLYAGADLYPEISLILDRLTEDQMHSLHRGCDCFVMPSNGESCCLPALDALGFGNNIVVNENSGIASLDDMDWIYPIQTVKSYPTPIVMNNSPLPEVYNGNNLWYPIDIIDLSNALLNQHDMWKRRSEIDWEDDREVPTIDYIKQNDIYLVSQMLEEHIDELISN
jgi:glycosyltransferase involved in cell wall biosynthesis